ncbi:hypothetical protein O3Q51_12785 [Cryomorphaceae bacterium 1068]|nr:hypothetical protein [Cryomorphaceae bacterium 1068]
MTKICLRPLFVLCVAFISSFISFAQFQSNENGGRDLASAQEVLGDVSASHSTNLTSAYLHPSKSNGVHFHHADVADVEEEETEDEKRSPLFLTNISVFFKACSYLIASSHATYITLLHLTDASSAVTTSKCILFEVFRI